MFVDLATALCVCMRACRSTLRLLQASIKHEAKPTQCLRAISTTELSEHHITFGTNSVKSKTLFCTSANVASVSSAWRLTVAVSAEKEHPPNPEFRCSDRSTRPARTNQHQCAVQPRVALRLLLLETVPREYKNSGKTGTSDINEIN